MLQERNPLLCELAAWGALIVARGKASQDVR